MPEKKDQLEHIGDYAEKMDVLVDGIYIMGGDELAYAQFDDGSWVAFDKDGNQPENIAFRSLDEFMNVAWGEDA